MATGDDALAEGMELVDGASLANTLDTEDNKSRDYIAQFFRAAKAYVDQKVGAISLTWGAITGKPSRFATTWSLVDDKPSLVSLGYFNDRLAPGANQPIYVQGNVVSSSYVAMYRNGDGRVGISPSALRFKKFITDHPYTLDDACAVRPVNYHLKAEVYGNADAPAEIGVIAEDLIEAGLGEFVAYDDAGEPLSVHYERLALVALGALREVSHRLARMERPKRISGTIRWMDAHTWAVVDDAAHRATGIARVELRADRVRVHYAFTAETIGDVQVTPDEGFSSAGIRPSASVGLSYADVFFHRDGSAEPINPALLSKANANVWISGEFDRWSES